MQFNPLKVKYLEVAREQDLIPELNELILNESIQKFASRRFKPIMRANNYVAYAAFHSRLLTKFIYFSPFSKFKDAILRRIRGEKGKKLFEYYG
jgi:TnpA family transposase